MSRFKKSGYIRIILLVAVLVLFAWYFVTNQNQFSKIGNLSLWQGLLIVTGQSIVILSNVFVLKIIAGFTGKQMPFLDSVRVTAYSSLINFFGFLQGGVGFRGIYLKRYYGLTLKRYTLLTIIQYLVFFGIAGLLLVIGLALVLSLSNILLIAVGSLLLVILLALLIYKIKPGIYTQILQKISGLIPLVHARPILFIALITIVQLAGSMLANSVELSVIGAHITFGGLLIYTGISQFAIIVALTPGAIGIREGILLLVQSQMMLSTSDIVLAATIDRLVYFVTLGLFTPLALSIKGTIGKDKL